MSVARRSAPASRPPTTSPRSCCSCRSASPSTATASSSPRGDPADEPVRRPDPRRSRRRARPACRSCSCRCAWRRGTSVRRTRRSELRIRVYPDQIHADGHRPELTDGEVAAGQAYWRNRWVAGADAAERQAAAWAELTRGVRPARAAHIVRTTAPTNAPPEAAGVPGRARRDRPPSTSRWRCVASPTAGSSSATTRRERSCCASGSTSRSPTGSLRRPSRTPRPTRCRPTRSSTRYLGWAADYTQALGAGMAVTVLPADVPNGNLSTGFARLVVVGVRAGDGAAELAALLADHAVSDGLAFLRPGQPTNNLGGDGPDAAVAVVPPAAGTRRRSDAAGAGDGRRVVGGRPPGGCARARRRRRSPRCRARRTRRRAVSSSVVAATWSATLGYFADELLPPLVSDDDARRRPRPRHPPPPAPRAAAHAADRAPAARRAPGRRPGLLVRGLPDRPVRRPARRAPRSAGTDVVGGGRAHADAPAASRTRRRTSTVDAALLAVLQRAPWTMRLRFRRVFGPLMGMSVTGLGADPATAGIVAVHRVPRRARPAGRATASRRSSCAPNARPLSVPDRRAEDLGYLARVRALTHRGRRPRSAQPAADAGSLLESLVTFGGAAGARPVSRAASARTVLPSASRRPSPRRGARPRSSTPSQSTERLADRAGDDVPRARAGRANARRGDRSSARSSPGRRTPTWPSWPSSRRRWRARGRRTGGRRARRAGPARRLLAPPRRLADIAGQPSAGRGARRPADAAPTSAATAASSELRPETSPDSSGYVTGPSLAHAATAGVLRSAHLANGVAGIDRLDVDLSSARVAARPRADAWRARGHAADGPARLPPGAGPAGGRTCALFILPLRTMFPIRDVPDPPPGVPARSTPPHDVVDALSLLEPWMHPSGDLLRAAAGDRPGRRPVRRRSARWPRWRRLETLADVFDAIGDLMLAEAVHQTVAGQPGTSPGGDAVPRPPGGAGRAGRVGHAAPGRFVRPPLRGRHRAAGAERAVAGAGRRRRPRGRRAAASTAGWPTCWANRARGRSPAERSRPTAPSARPRSSRPPTSGSARWRWSLAAVTGAGEHASELEQRIARVDRRAPRGRRRHRAAGDHGRLGSGWPSSSRWPARSAGCCGPPGPVTPGSSTCRTARAPAGVDIVELTGAGRGSRAARCATRTRALDAAIGAPTPTVGAGRGHRRASAAPACRGAVPPVGLLHGAPATPRRREAIDVAAAVAAARPAPARPARRARRRRTPRRRPRTADRRPCSARRSRCSARSPCRTALAPRRRRRPVDAHRRRPAGGRHVVDADVQGPPRARRGVAPGRRRRGDDRRVHGDGALHRAAARPRRRPWAALPFDRRGRPPGRRRPSRPSSTRRAAGSTEPIGVLVVDSWTEQIPVAVETAGIALQYDAPSNRAPQVALLAVPPDVAADRPWSVDALLSVVEQSLDMAHARGVTLEELPAAGSVLPALYVPFDLGDDVPSVDLGRLVTVHAARHPRDGQGLTDGVLDHHVGVGWSRWTRRPTSRRPRRTDRRSAVAPPPPVAARRARRQRRRHADRGHRRSDGDAAVRYRPGTAPPRTGRRPTRHWSRWSRPSGCAA